MFYVAETLSQPGIVVLKANYQIVFFTDKLLDGLVKREKRFGKTGDSDKYGDFGLFMRYL